MSCDMSTIKENMIKYRNKPKDDHLSIAEEFLCMVAFLGQRNGFDYKGVSEFLNSSHTKG